MKLFLNLIFIFVLAFYPFIAYAVRDKLDMEPDYVLGFLCFAFLGKILVEKYLTDESIRLPHYLSIFGIFTGYTILTSIFVSDNFEEEGAVKYFYSDPYVRSFVALLVVENIQFSTEQLKKVALVLSAMLVIASGVAVAQISDPFFFLYQPVGEWTGQNTERIIEMLDENPELIDGDKDRMLAGYRMSIYSWINNLSVGMDGLAIFSILLGWDAYHKRNKIIIGLATALFAFLSSARWILLNFFVIAFQTIIRQKNWVLSLIKYSLLAVGLIFLTGYAASFAGVDIEAFIEKRLLDKGANTRLYAFEVFGKVFPDQPIFGTGAADTEEMLRLIKGKTSQIHVGWLKLFYYYGLVGGIIYLIFVAALLYHMWEKARLSKYYGSFFAILAFVVANCTLVELDLFYHGLFLAIIFSRHIDNREP